MPPGHTVGVQTVVFEHCPIDGLLDGLGETGVDTVEIGPYHLSPDDDEATIAAAERAFDEAGVTIRGYGVADIADPDGVRRHAAFADRLGAAYLAVNYPPARDDVTEALIAAAEEFDLDVAIHNYSTIHHDDLSTVFSSIEDVRGVVERYEHPRLGICVDTGHFLAADVDPEAAVRELGDRVVVVHLKDTSDEEIEDLPGAGRLDVPRIVDLIDEYADPSVPFVVEYELPPERAAEALREAEATVRAAIE